MILRHAREPMDNQPAENTFEAVDEHSGALLGACTIYAHENAELFPARPLRVYLDIQGEPAPDALLGAAVARAKELALLSGLPSRVFCQVEPDDSALLTSLSALGFRDNDGLVSMQKKLPCEKEYELPLGCVTVLDDLDDPIEQEYFLERYNQLFNEEYDMEWLEEFRAHEGFKRILIVSNAGMLGEACIWQDGSAGVIGWLHTARRWRRKGIARCLLGLACEEFAKRSLSVAQGEIQARIPCMLKVMEGSGFRQAKLLLRYPGVDIG